MEGRDYELIEDGRPFQPTTTAVRPRRPADRAAGILGDPDAIGFGPVERQPDRRAKRHELRIGGKACLAGHRIALETAGLLDETAYDEVVKNS